MNPILVSKIFFGLFGAFCIGFVLWVIGSIVLFYVRRRKYEREQKRREAADKAAVIDAWVKKFEELNK